MESSRKLNPIFSHDQVLLSTSSWVVINYYYIFLRLGTPIRFICISLLIAFTIYFNCRSISFMSKRFTSTNGSKAPTDINRRALIPIFLVDSKREVLTASTFLILVVRRFLPLLCSYTSAKMAKRHKWLHLR